MILRGILSFSLGGPNALSAAAGIACRLLQSAGCWLVSDVNKSSSQDVAEVGFSFIEQTLNPGEQSVYLKVVMRGYTGESRVNRL